MPHPDGVSPLMYAAGRKEERKEGKKESGLVFLA